jgi:predicted alpha-1,6-mannanase (GH76 family)
LTTLGDLAALDPITKITATVVFANSIIQAQNYNLWMDKIVLPDFNIETLYPTALASSAASSPNGFLNDYYDDEGWWAHAWIQAYDVTGDRYYLQTAASIFEDMKNGSTTNCGGGIWWSKANTYVNAIANELYLSAAAHLANRMSNKQYYLDIALQQWAWFEKSGMINADNAINDGLTSTCTNNGGTVWSYNQGVILGGLVELNIAAPSLSYLTTATNIATAAIHALSDSNNVLHDPCEPNCGADGTQFKGVFMRNLQRLQQAAPNSSLLASIAANAQSIWASDRNGENALSVVWSGPFVAPANASTQSSALDALVAAAAFDGKGINS